MKRNITVLVVFLVAFVAFELMQTYQLDSIRDRATVTTEFMKQQQDLWEQQDEINQLFLEMLKE